MGPAPRRALRRMIASSRADYVAAWFSKGSPERAAAIASGIVPIPGRVALDLVARPLRDLPVDVESLASWDLSLSDLELL